MCEKSMKPRYVEDDINIRVELELRELFEKIEYVLIDPRIKSGTTFDFDTKFSRIVMVKK